VQALDQQLKGFFFVEDRYYDRKLWWANDTLLLVF